MTPYDLFPGKLRTPHLTERLVRRPRLEQTLDDGVARGIVLVSAPPGGGKTQLVASWARHQATPRDVTWVTLDEGDRDPVRFMKYVIAAIAATPSGRDASGPPGALAPVSSIDEAYLLTVSDALSRLSADVVVVLDDFQAIVGSESERLLGRILRYKPDGIRVIVLSRVEPALGQTRLRLQGLVVEVDARTLALTRGEAAELLRLHDLELDDADIDVLHAHTEGWPAGMQVLAAAIRESGDPGSFIDGLGGEAAMGDYLMAEVFENQPPEVQRFLLRASTANPVCGDLADALTGSPGGARTLAELYVAHIFLDRIDDPHRVHVGDEMQEEKCTWYRWHPMFANLLRQRRRATERDMEEQLHLTASTWYRHHGFPLEAVRQAAAGEDIDTAVRLLGASWLDLVLSGESAELRSLLASFNESQKEEHADLAVVCGFLRLQDRDLSGASACVERAVSQSAALPADRRDAVEMMSAAIRLRIATLTGHEAEDAYKSALLLLQQSDGNRALLSGASKRRRSLVLYDLSAYEVSRWLYEEPREHLQDVMAAAGTLGMTHLALRARAQVAFLDFFSGRLHSAQETAREVVDAAERRGWRSHHSLATAQHALGGIDIFRGDLDAGLQRLAEAREIVDPVDQVNRFRIGFTTLIGLRAKGAVREARQGLEQLQVQHRRWKTPPKWAEVLLLITEAEQLALEGHTGRALGLLDSVPEATVHPIVRRHSQVFHAQLLLRSGKPAEAQAALQHIIHPPGGWLIDIRALVVNALAAEALGRHGESIQALDLAVEKAAVEGIREPFLVSGPRTRPLLQKLLERGTSHESEVLDILNRLTPRGENGSGSPYLAEPLTARELEVLRALQGTASNEQIANRLFISLNTLRTHIKHIHSKLGVTSRSDAVERGRALGIL